MKIAAYVAVAIATLLVVSIPVLFYGTIIYVVVHFIHKVW